VQYHDLAALPQCAQIRLLDRRIAAEQRRSEESIEMRKRML
jgi:hypothetical protein